MILNISLISLCEYRWNIGIIFGINISLSLTQVPAGGALPLSQLSRLRPQSHSSSPYYRPETLEQMLNRKSADKFLGRSLTAFNTILSNRTVCGDKPESVCS